MKVFILALLVLVFAGYLYWYYDVPEAVVPEPEVSFVGSWVSDDDVRATVSFDENGTYEYRYDGEVVNSGEWELDGTRLTEYTDLGELEFIVLTLNATTLEMSYVGRGSTLRYSRVPD